MLRTQTERERNDSRMERKNSFSWLLLFIVAHACKMYMSDLRWNVLSSRTELRIGTRGRAPHFRATNRMRSIQIKRFECVIDRQEAYMHI